jgi:hypothetical protein
MNVKISYTIPFENVPAKVDELLMEASRNLEQAGGSLKPNSFDDEPTVTAFKLDLIKSTRQKMLAIDLLLEDCYTILASYNMALANLHMPKSSTEGEHNESVQQGGFSSSPTESPDGAVRR